ncbi:MAG: hypothetical protein V4485_02225 [Pseudomonadota bacterium]
MSQNKSFARRIGKSLSKLQLGLLKDELPRYLLDPEKLPHKDKYIAEIGIGMGDHFVERARLDQSALHIGFEPYLNGVANSLKIIQENEIANILLWPDDVDLVISALPDNILDELYILFPDPWPKTPHHKRRILNKARIKQFASKIKTDGILYFVSDILHYFDAAEEVISGSNLFKDIKTSDEPYEGYIKTKYHHKADLEGRSARFLVAKRKASESNQTPSS